jgi:hypothetical protein
MPKDVINNLYCAGFNGSSSAITLYSAFTTNDPTTPAITTVVQSAGSNTFIAKWNALGAATAYALIFTATQDMIYSITYSDVDQALYACTSVVGSTTVTVRGFSATSNVINTIVDTANAFLVQLPNNGNQTAAAVLGQSSNTNNGAVEMVSCLFPLSGGGVVAAGNFTQSGTLTFGNMGVGDSTSLTTYKFTRDATVRAHLMGLINYSSTLTLNWVGIFETNYRPYFPATPSEAQSREVGESPPSLCCATTAGIFHLCTFDVSGGVILGSVNSTGVALDSRNITVGAGVGWGACLILYSASGTYLTNAIFTTLSALSRIRSMEVINDTVYASFYFVGVLTYMIYNGSATLGSLSPTSNGTVLFKIRVVGEAIVSNVISYNDIV